MVSTEIEAQTNTNPCLQAFGQCIGFGAIVFEMDMDSCKGDPSCQNAAWEWNEASDLACAEVYQSCSGKGSAQM